MAKNAGKKKTSGKEVVYVTEEGLARLKEELDRLINVDRPAVVQKIMLAREHGDITDNAEYESAREDQAFIEGRILELENTIARAHVVEAESSGSSVNIVEVGTTVTVTIDNKEEETFTIVGSAEAVPLEGKISNESPVGNSLLGLSEGDKVEVTTPQATITYHVKKIH